MKLFWSSRSPFARKVMIAAHELGIAAEIATERVVADPVDANREVMKFNPLGRIRTMILGDGTVLHDSVVIIEYLDTRFGGAWCQ
jgi:glutathione S-transferase